MNLNPYTFAIIYKIYSKIGDVTYYGSTIDLMERIRTHKKNNDCSSREVLKFPDYKFSIVQYFPCEDKKQLERKEGYYQKNFKCVNKKIAGRTDKEWREDNKEIINKKRKEYLNKNREKINTKQREKINCDCGGKYTRAGKSGHMKTEKHLKYKNSKLTKKEYSEYIKKQKEEKTKKIKCECGCEFQPREKNRHSKSKKHLKYINSLKEITI